MYVVDRLRLSWSSTGQESAKGWRPKIVLRKLSQRLPSPIRGTLTGLGRALVLFYRVGLLGRVVFIGVTGSTGKTTTKDLIHAILSTRFTGHKSRANDNLAVHETIYQVRPSHAYCVQEIAAAIGGQRVALERPLDLVRPRIGVVTNIGTDHIGAFGSIEEIAAEKGKLIAMLPQDGVAVLNADDPNVLAMRSRFRGKAVTYGLSPDAMVRAENIDGAWPNRLAFECLHDGGRYRIQTQLCGKHWVPCVLAALSVGLELGVPLADAARAVSSVMPNKRRMEPISGARGITFIRDDIKASLNSIPPALEFMKDARASRKIIVIGTISDYTGNSETTYKRVAKSALEAADMVIFVGPKASKCSKVKNTLRGNSLWIFASVAQARDHLDKVLQAGDLVLLKASERADRFDLIYSLLEMSDPEPGKGAKSPEIVPEETASPTPRVHALRPHVTSDTKENSVPMELPNGGPGMMFIIGLGNPEAELRQSPHNVGHQALDDLARFFGVEWTSYPDALLASTTWNGAKLCLVKPMVHVNQTGAVLQSLADEFRFGPDECILVHDDMDLPLGAVRVRAKGSDGGHRGVRSVLQAFGSASITRVKIGVGRPAGPDSAARYVLSPFSPKDSVAVSRVCAEVAGDIIPREVTKWLYNQRAISQ
ncbi:aminoacyl-tRNA hydrolase [Microvirga calopogonii]|uniref:aminoacyl-tRNA hydrolase n=1 Tax=Microvirga calopogonii TaxID=2078013 RepID=UPI000E0D80E3|nr:aminoacyl-tRNA hydrolase [Microvirga calopogonii]